MVHTGVGRRGSHTPYSTSLEKELAAKARALMRFGALMLNAGTGSFRVKTAMGRIANRMGIDDLDLQVSLNELVLMASSGPVTVTQVREVAVPSINADRIGRLLRLSFEVKPGITANELHSLVDEVTRAKPPYRFWGVVLAAFFACAAFAFLNNGRISECLMAGIAGGVGKLVQLRLSRLRVNFLAVVALSSFVACLVYASGAVVVDNIVGIPGAVATGSFTSAILFLVPGFGLVTAALDLARFDFTVGVSRVMFTGLVTLAAALGAWAVASCFGLTATPTTLPLPPGLLLTILRIVASFVGVAAFAVTLHTPWRTTLWASCLGAVVNTVRLSSIDAGTGVITATAIATMVVGLVAHPISLRLRVPRITLSVPSVLVMIPGAIAYRTLMAIINSDTTDALMYGATSLGIVLGICVGLVTARILTDPAWQSPRPTWTHLRTAMARHVRDQP